MEAESAAIGAPPAWLERVVLFLLPPAARETVAGDLWEMYRAPLQYVSQVAGILPFVIASQIRRNANVPLLALQAAILLACFGALFSVSAPGALVGAKAAGFTIATLFGLLLYDAYQRPERPTSHHAILETIMVALGILLLFPQFLLGTLLVLPAHIAWWPGLALMGCFLVIVPLLCLLRTGLIVSNDQGVSSDELSAENILQDFDRFQRRIAGRNQLEGAALIVAALFCAFGGGLLGLSYSGISLMAVGVYGAAGLYLLFPGTGCDMPVLADFRSLRAHYQDELAHRLQLRRFLWWLWATPLFLATYSNFIHRGVVHGQPTLVTLGIVIALLLGFFIGAFNRERSGPFREKIALLNRLQEYALQ